MPGTARTKGETDNGEKLTSRENKGHRQKEERQVELRKREEVRILSTLRSQIWPALAVVNSLFHSSSIQSCFCYLQQNGILPVIL